MRNRFCICPGRCESKVYLNFEITKIIANLGVGFVSDAVPLYTLRYVGMTVEGGI